MLVVSDATPLNILIRLTLVDILPKLFSEVVVPTSVAEEMSRLATPEIVRVWMGNPPPWLSIRSPAHSTTSAEPRHRGERDAIALAREIKADAILLDEYKPRLEAQRLGLAVIGTVGILERAANDGLINDLAAVHAQLRSTDFHVADILLDNSLARHNQHKQAAEQVPNKSKAT